MCSIVADSSAFRGSTADKDRETSSRYVECHLRESTLHSVRLPAVHVAGCMHKAIASLRNERREEQRESCMVDK